MNQNNLMYHDKYLIAKPIDSYKNSKSSKLALLYQDKNYDIYKNKYYKYKKKYLNLKNKLGGSQKVIIKKNKSEINNENFSNYFINDLTINLSKDSVNNGIPIPLYEYSKDDDDTIDRLVQDVYNNNELVKKFFKLIRHISFKEFYSAIVKKTNEFNQIIGNQKYILIVNGGMDLRKYNKNLDKVKEKSNYWISKLVYLNLNIKPNIILDYNYNRLISESINTSISDGTKSINILMCDDMMYSGNQMIGYIKNIVSNIFEEFQDIQNINLYLIIPFISSMALDRISNITLNYIHEETKSYSSFDISGKSLNINILFEEDIKSLSNYFSNEEYFNLSKIFDKQMFEGSVNLDTINEKPHVAIYFDHKLADYQSSFPLIIPKIITRCKNIKYLDNRIPPCPVPPYKSRSDEKYKKRVNFEILQSILQEKNEPEPESKSLN